MELFDYSSVKSIDLPNLKPKNASMNPINYNNFVILSNSIIKDINEENIKTRNIIKNKEITANILKKPLKVVDDSDEDLNKLTFQDINKPIIKQSEKEKPNNAKENITKINTKEKVETPDKKPKKEEKVKEKIVLTEKTNLKIDRVNHLLRNYFGLSNAPISSQIEGRVDWLTFVNEINDKIMAKVQSRKIPLQKIFMRKRIIKHILKVVEVLLSGSDEKVLQKLVLLIEGYARDKDPNLNDGYKTTITSFFNSIKVIIFA